MSEEQHLRMENDNLRMQIGKMQVAIDYLTGTLATYEDNISEIINQLKEIKNEKLPQHDQ